MQVTPLYILCQIKVNLLVHEDIRILVKYDNKDILLSNK